MINSEHSKNSKFEIRSSKFPAGGRAVVMAGLLVLLVGSVAAADQEPQVVVVEPTNSLLINATAEQHARIADIINYVDSKTEVEEIPYKIYQLENQDPEELATTMNQLVQEAIKDKEGKIQQVVRRTEENIIIIPDKNTFSLIVYASKKNQEWISKLIEDLDKRRPQVLIDVSLVEITREEAFKYDLDIISSFPDLTGTSGLTDAIMSISADSSNLVEKLTSSDRDRFIDLQFNPSREVKTNIGFYGDRHINALFKAMEDEKYGRILARPKLLVNDNEQGEIKTTLKTHHAEVTTTWHGAEQPTPTDTVSWQPYEASINLVITPHISEGDLLRLEVQMLREDFDKPGEVTIGQTKYTPPPDYRTSNVNTIITVPDGSTIILGGLTKLDQQKAGSKVPLIGDIPIIGGLFRTVDNSDLESKLYLFVKANIVRPDETLKQLRQISDENRAAYEEFERRFQKKQDWPGIKSKTMRPEKALGGT